MLLSIIMAVYNTEEYLEDAILSILNNGCDNIELIIVNDGSNDGSSDIIERFESDPRVRVIHKLNGGLSSARNAGLDIARGDLITFVDSDDVIESGTYAGIIDYLEEHPEVDIVEYPLLFEWTTAREIKKEWSKGSWYIDDKVDIITHLLLEHITYSSCDKVYRRSIIGEVRFVEGIVNEDNIFNVALFDKVKVFYHTSLGEYKYRGREGSIMSRKWSLRQIDNWCSAMNAVARIAIKYRVSRECRVSFLWTYDHIGNIISNYETSDHDAIWRMTSQIKPLSRLEVLYLRLFYKLDKKRYVNERKQLRRYRKIQTKYSR